jgi:hypothetical protein
MKQGVLGVGSLAHGGEDSTEVRSSGYEAVPEEGQPASRVFSCVISEPGPFLLSGPACLAVPDGHTRWCEHACVVAYRLGVWPAHFQFADECPRFLDVFPLQQGAEVRQVAS